ncbi:hypothetical protein H0H87_011368 [Tephrocybe sp. NHM501043]|nr:hypothetical protein H0H87_011368 [Tephrocybe sp. NHM501043]
MSSRNRRPRPDDRLMSGSAAVAKKPRTEAQQAPVTQRAPSPTSSKHFSDRTFQSASLSCESKAAIKHEYMSDVQAATIDLGLAGKDMLVQAKTGTGKTIAFLLPAIERLAKARQPPKGISVLVLAPTRELALQIEKEAQILIEHHKHMSVGHVIGGLGHVKSLNTILKQQPTILVATPGRLFDHLTTPEIAASVQSKFTGLQALVYDEADRLLDQGFRRELDGILKGLPDRQQSPRQVMLFSATISKEIQQIAQQALNKDHVFVSTLLEDEANTHEHVPQTSIIAPFNATLPLSLRIIADDRAIHPKMSKVIMFFPTARHVSLAAELLQAVPGLPTVYELHSRMSQTARVKASAKFAEAQEAVLVSSDVAARGMDFPGYVVAAALAFVRELNVTLVVQLGLPASTEQYIHRLGRTARAGTAGRGTIILDPSEAPFLGTRATITLGIKPDSSESLPLLAEEEAMIATALKVVSPNTKAQAYRAWLGYYKAHLKLMKWTSEKLVVEANKYVKEALGWKGTEELEEGQVGEGKPPSVEPKLVGKMGMKGVKGLNIVKPSPQQGGGGGGRGSRGGSLTGPPRGRGGRRDGQE